MSQVPAAGSASVKPVTRVLIIEDDGDLRAMLQELLIAEGYACLDAEDRLEALDWLSQVPVDLVVVDILMPRLSGHELIKKMRQTTPWATTPILLLSGYADLTPMKIRTISPNHRRKVFEVGTSKGELYYPAPRSVTLRRRAQR